MTYSNRSAAIIVAMALLATVATQIFYMGVVSPSDSAILRKATWTTEMALFSIVAVAGMALAERSKSPLIWAAISIAGIVNIIQVGMGLAEFGPAREAGDEKVFQTVLNGAFFLYFHGKAMIGLAAVGVGLAAWGQMGGLVKALGSFSILAGIAAVVLNMLGMANGMDHVFPAGAAGTAATALFALTVLLVTRED